MPRSSFLLHFSPGRAAKELLESQQSFDPLALDKKNRVKALSVFVASIVISLALAESVSKDGIRFDL